MDPVVSAARDRVIAAAAHYAVRQFQVTDFSGDHGRGWPEMATALGVWVNLQHLPRGTYFLGPDRRESTYAPIVAASLRLLAARRTGDDLVTAERAVDEALADFVQACVNAKSNAEKA